MEKNFKRLFAIVTMVLIFCMLITGCGNNNAPEQESSRKSSQQESAVTDPGESDAPEVVVDTAVAGEIEMDYLKFGSGSKTFVILPGLSVKPVTLSAEAVAQGFADFAEDYTVYLFDRRTNLPDSYSVEDMAADTVAIMKSLGIERADLFGASQGGMIAMSIAIQYPEAVNKMVLGSTAARPNENLQSVIDEFISLAEAKDGYALNEAFCKAVYSETVYEAYKDVLLPAGNEITESEMDRFLVLASSLGTLKLYDKLDQIACEVLVLGSEGDRVTTADASREIAEKLGCESYIYDDTYGHAVYDEAPDYRGRMLAFLRQ